MTRCPRCMARLYRDPDIEYGWCLHCGSVRLAPYDESWVDEITRGVRFDRRREGRVMVPESLQRGN